MKQRITYIDISKGILMVCLLLSHLGTRSLEEGMNNPCAQLILRTQGLYNAFFMPTFFFITGFCTTFSTRFGTFVWKNLKGLILPSLILFVAMGYLCDLIEAKELNCRRLLYLTLWLKCNGPWFIISLFWCKMLYFGLNRLNLKVQVLLIALLYGVGLALVKYDPTPNYWYHRHTLLLLPFLFMGTWAKGRLERWEPYFGYVALFAVLFILAQNVLYWMHLYTVPSIDFFIRVSWRNVPVHFINVITGSVLVLYVARRIGRSELLATIGRGSLVVYLGDKLIYLCATRLLSLFLDPEVLWMCGLYYALALLLRIGLAYLLVRLIYDHKYLSWIVGKW